MSVLTFMICLVLIAIFAFHMVSIVYLTVVLLRLARAIEETKHE